MKKNFQFYIYSLIIRKSIQFCFIFLFYLGSINVYSQTSPTPFDLSGGNYSFTTWAATSTAGTYPPNMYFHITTTLDPGLAVAMTGNYSGAYSGSGSIIGGLGSNGFYFYNMGTAGYLGAATIALNSTNRTSIKVSWIGGTYTSGGASVYAIRLQYRITITGTWTDVPGPVEYVTGSAGTTQSYGPSTLPSTCDNNAVIQLRWKYYNTGITGGTRPKLSVGSISVTSSIMTPAPTVQASNITFTNVSTTSFKVNWTNGNGANRIVLIKSGSAVNFIPVNNTCYTANTVFSSGTQLGTGNYSVFSDVGNNCTITGLIANTSYYVAIYEYNGTCPGTLISYLTTLPATSSQLTSANPSPSITTSLSTLPDFGSTVINSGLGGVQFFTVTGTALTDTLKIKPPIGFNISLSNAPFTTKDSIFLLKDMNGTVAATTIYVRFSPILIKLYCDSILIKSTGATSKYVKLTGKGIKAVPTNHITGLLPVLIVPYNSSVKLSWNDATVGVLPDAYIIKGSNISYASIANPVDGVTPVTDLLNKSILQGVKSVTFTGLSSSTTYYFKIYPYTNSGTDIKFKTDGTIPSTTISTTGMGTVNAPLTCNEAIQNNTGTNVWVKGFIVGSAYSAISVETDSTSLFQYDTNIALADSVTQSDVSKMLFIKLTQNFLRPVLNLLDNHGNFHKQVEVNGDLMAFYTPHAGMQNTDDFKWFESPISTQSGNWNNAYTWNTGIPGVNDTVTVNTNVFVDAAALCNKLTISQNGSLTIGAGNTLSIVDSLIIQSGVSLIDYNNQSINSKVERDLTSADWNNGSDGWRIISSPVNLQPINGCWTSGIYDFYSYDEVSDQWLNQVVSANNITDFILGKAYFVAYQNDTNKQFKGVLNHDDVFVNLTYTPNGGKGYNLIGNPFPSSIRWNNSGTNNWNLTNVESIAKVWNETNQTYSQLFNNDLIPSNQGFFVKAIAPVTGFVIPKLARVIDSHPFYKSLSNDMLTFTVSNSQNECKVSSYVLFNASATTGYDLLYESSELKGSSIAPRLFSLLPTGEKLSVNALPNITVNTIVNIVFVPGVNANYTIRMDSNNVSNFISIILHDNKTSISQDLMINPSFNFMANITDNPDRFKLYLNVTSTVGISNNESDILNVLSKDKSIEIKCKENIKEVSIYNILGQQIYYRNYCNTKECIINLNDILNGSYIVKVTTSKATYTKKIQIQ